MGSRRLHQWTSRVGCLASYLKWAVKGKPMPVPHRVKQKIVADYALRYGIDTLIETGTYLGDMVDAMRPFFCRIYSVELSRDLYEKAVERFRPFAGIVICRGDSADILPDILGKVHGPCLFWLDGHYSSGMTARGRTDTPIAEELSHILARTADDVILIDDAVLFTGKDGYPTYSDLSAQVRRQRPDVIVQVKDDVIRCHKK